MNCLYCGKSPYDVLADGSNLDMGGEIKVRNLLGATVTPHLWKLLRCPNCGNVQLFRLNG